MSTDFASMVAGLAPENLDTAAAAVRSNAALFAAVGKAHAEASGLEPKAKRGVCNLYGRDALAKVKKAAK